VSGSGPAYVFSFMEALKSAATQLGLSREQAHLMVLQTTLGAARLAMECGGESLSDLRRRVTSPNGITEAAMQSLKTSDFSVAISQAVDRAHHRAQELSDQLMGH
jgi:pyrroline-5-carboxylate reductase